MAKRTQEGRPRINDVKSAYADHTGVTVMAPDKTTKKGRRKHKHYRLRYIAPGETRLNPEGELRSTYRKLEGYTEAEAYAEARRVSLEIGLYRNTATVPEVQQNLDQNGATARTLQAELTRYIDAGRQDNMDHFEADYAVSTVRNYQRSVDAFTAFAQREGCRVRDSDGALYLSAIDRWYPDGTSLLSRWKEHERAKGNGNPNTLMAMTKPLHALLADIKVAGGKPMFDSMYLKGELPVRATKAKRPARVMKASELRAILQQAMLLDTPEHLVSADIALLLLTVLRRCEITYLQVRHCQINQVPDDYEDQVATWIELPSKLAVNHLGEALAEEPPKARYNHAKNGDARFPHIDKYSPLCAQLLAAMCSGRSPTEWVTTLTYASLDGVIRTISKALDLKISSKEFRTTGVNHCHRVMEKTQEAVNYCGHTEDVMKKHYRSKKFVMAIQIESHATLEASMGIEHEVKSIIKKARKHKRSCGNVPRPLPSVLRGGKPFADQQATPSTVPPSTPRQPTAEHSSAVSPL